LSLTNPESQIENQYYQNSNEIIKPQYLVIIGSEKYTEQSSNIISIRAFRGLGLPTDSCEVILQANSRTFSTNAETKIFLGNNDSRQEVFSGSIESIHQEINTTRIISIGQASKLMRLRVNRVFLNQTTGKITSSIAKAAGIPTNEVSNGINLPYYVVDERRSAFEHILKLAEFSGYNVFFNAGKLEFKPFSQSKNHIFTFGTDILWIEAYNRSPLFYGAQVAGESPASVKGLETAHWLTKQQVRASSGSDAFLSTLDSSLKEKETVQTVADSKTLTLTRNRGISLKVVGNSDVNLGDTVLLKNLSLVISGTLEVVSFEHRLSKTDGFTTIINCLSRGDKQ
jgi:hypothetical protein